MASRELKRIRLRKIIIELSENVCDEAGISFYIKKLKEIYKDDFRHSYSSLTGCIMDEYKAKQYDEVVFANIVQNLQTVIDFSEMQKENNKFIDKIEKLLDHISLEYSRVQRIYSEYDTRVKNAEKKLEEAEILSNKTFDNSDKLKTEVITILSVFAAIVLAFMGGMSFTASTFEGIASTSFYRVSFISTICGFVVFNTVALLLYMISKIVGRLIYAKCETKDCSCKPQCCTLTRIRRRLPFIFWVNLTLLVLLICITIGWIIDARSAVECIRELLPWNK